MNLAKAVGVGALSLLAIGGWKVFTNLSGRKHLPSKEETLQILQNVRQQFYPILIKIADFVAKELAPRGISPDQNERLVMLDPEIKKEIQKLNEKIYHKYTESEVKEATERLFKDDGNIKHQKNQFKQEYKKSLLGVRPERQMTISRKIKREKVLETVEAILQDKIDRLETQIGGEKIVPEELKAFLETDVEEDERTTKQYLREKLGLSAKDSIKIFHFLVVQYRKCETFEREYQEIIEKYNKKVSHLCDL